MSGPFILAIDEGTTRVTVALLDEHARVHTRRSAEVTVSFPRPGWVEQDAEKLFQTVVATAAAVLEQARVPSGALAGIGIANQRETVVVWERATGIPLGPAIVWQDRRGASRCAALEQAGAGGRITAQTGLVLDPYFSATKLEWLFESDRELARQAESGRICVGTIDSFLLFRLSGGARHATDATNASRTMLMDLSTQRYSPELCELFGVDPVLLPEIVVSGAVHAEVDSSLFGQRGVPIAALVGDQQSALYAQGCRAPGQAKCTYGTGSFVLSHTGRERAASPGGLISTIAVGDLKDAQFALEGSILSTGSAVQWLRDGLGVIDDVAESESLARAAREDSDVWFVPALAGLGAPYWDAGARGALLGLSGATGRSEVVRAVLEGIAWRTRDVLEAMGAAHHEVTELHADGAAAANTWLMQFQADATGVVVEVAPDLETTVLGAGYLAGVSVGLYRHDEVLAATTGRRYEPTRSAEWREARAARWHEAVSKTVGWSAPSS